MAIEDTSISAPFQPQPQPGQAASAAFVPPAKPFGGTSSNPFGFAGVTLSPGRIAGAPIRNLMGAESYVKLAKEMKEIAKEQNATTALEINVLELDRNIDPNLHFACFVVTAHSVGSPKLGVGYNIVMMEATGEPPKSQTESINGENVEIPRFTEAAADNQLIKIAEGLLKSRFGSDVSLWPSDTAVVPNDFNYEDKEAVRGLTANAAMAATISLIMFAANGQHFIDLNLVSELRDRRKGGDQGDADLSFIYNFHPKDTVDHLKLPTRASVVIQSQTGYRKSQRNMSLNSDSGPKTLTETCGFVELFPIAPRQQFLANPYAPVPPRLAPVFVMTKLSTSFAFTPGAMETCILVAADLNKGFGWLAAFANKSVGGSNNKLDITDVTAITVDIPSKLDPNVPEQRPAAGMPIDQLMTFLGSYCLPDLNIAIDVPQASATSWHLSIIAQAAMGNPVAINRMNQTMDLLTDGHFLKIFTKDVPIFAAPPLLIERGYWQDPTGLRRDIADIDYVAVCNYADMTSNPALVERWTNSFLRTTTSQAARLRDRREIINEITGHTAVFIGRSIRCFFNGKWVALGVQALANAGITSSSDGRGNFGFGGGRGHADFLVNAAMPTGAGWANAFGATSGGNYNFGGMAGNPWGGSI